jgi:hypothetical protein
MQRIEAIRHMAQVVTKDDLLTTSIGQTWDDWWNHKPADTAARARAVTKVAPAVPRMGRVTGRGVTTGMARV